MNHKDTTGRHRSFVWNPHRRYRCGGHLGFSWDAFLQDGPGRGGSEGFVRITRGGTGGTLGRVWNWTHGNIEDPHSSGL